MDLAHCTQDREDELQLSSSQLEFVTNQARNYWYSLADDARARLQNFNLIDTVSPQDILYKVPAFPASQLALQEVLLSDSGSKAIMTLASSTLRPTETENCNTQGTTKEVQSALLIGIQSPISCHFTGTCFQKFGVQGGDDRKLPNFTGIISLAWAYILSSRLAELQQQQGAGVSYTSSTAIWQHCDMEDMTAIEIEIGEVDESTARWWAAILAPRQGWKTLLLKKEDKAYYPPWSLSLDKGPKFKVVWHENRTYTPISTISPLSSEAAMRILAQFCSLHGLYKQLFAALFTALTFPTHKQLEITVELPLPEVTLTQTHLDQALDTSQVNELLSLSKDIPSFMALSCNDSVVMSSLCGSFWEPNIPCSLVSPWLHPILEEIPKAPWICEEPGRYYEMIALMCGQRRPRLRALWIGAALSGLVPKVLRYVRSGTPPLDPHGFAWTSSPQSFMDLPGSGPYFYKDALENNAIRRADAWRLLYLPTPEDDGLYYRSLPFSPWPPVGQTVDKNCALRIRVHESCPRHRLEYTHWTWKLLDGSSLNDQGFLPGEPSYPEEGSFVQLQRKENSQYPNIPISSSQDASREASFEIFRWVLANHEGKPPEPVYEHEWIAGCESDTGDECCSETRDEASSEDNYLNKKESCRQGRNIDGSLIPALQGTKVMEWMENTL
ncbi:hypothetical protein N7466_005124 [Penicillium verhagenii]|uniref:uncharacterized protein n=1 Tax=Penicillium verhagenii TaxID=1562060 RepID=UPI002544D865|nr:uncharacterized protein N7466_005124 [Penicillium verhagenii]KAJ5935577.1 hypothetical protein N7466_005124 [Penicillium verhagenii]